jgi:hypothetical protein
MDAKFTELLQAWLSTEAKERDYSVGALYLLKLTGNAVMYRSLIANLDARREFIEYQLQKYYDFRVQDLTHQQVEEMAAQVETIVANELSLSTEAAEFRKGKREDHDRLPDEIQACYVENLSLLQQMRELHLQLRNLSLENAPCPDSDRYPFLKELIRLDKKMHENWDRYDHYIISDEA